MHYIGLMSGTSVDGIDAVVVSIGPDTEFSLRTSHTESIPCALAERIDAAMRSGNDGIDQLGPLDMELGTLFAQAAVAVLKKADLRASDIRGIGSHGQTVRHRPTGQFPFTLQIGNPSVIAERTGITTVADFRARDMAVGGQGAPLVPAFHQWLFQSPAHHRAVVNIGGIANITCLPITGAVTGFDTGPGNTLLDQWARLHIKKNCDEGGKWAMGGKPSEPLLQRMLTDRYFVATAPKSTGREHFNLDWLKQMLDGIGSIAPQDVQATLVELTARSISSAIALATPKPAEVYVCGGGVHNDALMRALQHHNPGVSIQTTDAAGLDPDWVEACAFAWLAHRTLTGLPGNLPSVTGAKRAVVLGGIYPASRQ